MYKIHKNRCVLYCLRAYLYIFNTYLFNDLQGKLATRRGEGAIISYKNHRKMQKTFFNLGID